MERIALDPQPPNAFAAELSAIRRSRIVLAVASLPFVLGLALLVVAAAYSPSALILVPHALVLGWLLTWYAWRKNFLSSSHPARVAGDARGLAIGDRFIARARIRSGFVLPGQGRSPMVLIRRRFAPNIELQAATIEEARGLLRALGLDTSQTAVGFLLPSRARAESTHVVGLTLATLLVGLLAGVAARTVSPFSSMPVMAGTMLLLMVALAAPTSLKIGADGLAVRWLWTRRFIRYDSIATVRRYDRGWTSSPRIGLEFVLRSGETVRLLVHEGDPDATEIGIIEERIREAREAFVRGDPAADAALLLRGGRPIPEWVASLQSIGAGANATLRVAPVPRDRLLRLMEDPSLEANVRAAAAVAVGADPDDETRARLRVAADCTAEPKLRVAFDRALRGDPRVALEEALAEVAEEAAVTARRSG